MTGLQVHGVVRMLGACLLLLFNLCGVSLADDEPIAVTGATSVAAPAAAIESTAGSAASTVASPRADSYDVIFFAKARPIFIRFHIESNQKQLSDAWQTNLTDEFKFLDRDQSGKLETAELARAEAKAPGASNENAVLKTVGSILGIGRGAAPADDPGSLAGLEKRMRQSQPEFNVNFSGGAAASADRLFASLDQNGDKQIAADERASGVTRLTARDLDDDETLSLQELAVQPYPSLNFNNYALRSGGESSGSAIRTARFVTIHTPLDRQECADRWIREYGKQDRLRVFAGSPLAAAAKAAKVDSTASAGPLGLMFLDAAALAEILKQPPADMDVLIRLGAKKEKELPRVAFITPDGGALPKDAHGIRFSSTNGSRIFETAAERVELTASTENGPDQQRRQYKASFQQADMDKNKYIDKKEAEQSGDFNNLFDLIDVNGDEKIYEDEYLPWLDRQLASSASRAVLAANDGGHPFFPSFDTNEDGRIGLRELRVGLDRVLSRDANGDGSLSEDELVHLYRLSMGPGEVSLFQNNGVFFSYGGESDGRAKPTKGPEWFRNMDRNQDGDVSQREFLGTAEGFQKLDQDRDGLIDSNEAAAKKK